MADPHEEIVLSLADEWSAKVTLDCVIYRHQFEKFRDEYSAGGEDAALISALIFAHLYVECFLHQQMRIIIQLEFKFTHPRLYEDWTAQGSERRYIPEKLDAFVNTFIALSDQYGEGVVELKNSICTHLKNIAHPRNSFAHGHDISTIFGSGGSSESKAQKMLTEKTLASVTAEMNKLGDGWNDLLLMILPHCKSLRTIGDFMFDTLSEKR